MRAYDELDVYRSSGIITSMESRTRAYIKIQEGCDRFCSYCIIPYARGKGQEPKPGGDRAGRQRSDRPGFKELILTGINRRSTERISGTTA